MQKSFGFFRVMAAACIAASVAFGEPAKLGTTDTYWELADGVLTISGTGAMPNYSSVSVRPWHSQLTSITEVIIEEGVTSIGNRAFSGCSEITEVTIPDGMKTIGDETFYDCSKLTAITIPNSVTSIGTSAFSGCYSLTSVTIPGGVKTIKYSAFYGCSGLTSVTISSGVTSIDEAAFGACTGLTSVTVPNSVTSIGGGGFASCTKLTSVTIPNSVTSIGEYAFYACNKLTQVINWAATPLTINANVFESVTVANVKLFVPAQSFDTYKAKDNWKGFKVTAIPFTVKDEIAVGETLAEFDAAAEYTGEGVITWASGNDAVVIENGKITAGAGNTVRIIATLDGDYFSDVFEVSVVKAKITKPEFTAPSLVYTTHEQSAGIAPNAHYTITGDKATDAGEHIATVSLSDKDNYEWEDGTNADLTLSWAIKKAAGAAVVAPTLAVKTHNSITITAVVATSGQVVNYAISTTATAPTDAAAWKTDLTFTGLLANTDYYIFARTAENDNYNAGAVSAPLAVKTNAAPTPINKIQKSDGRVGIRLTNNVVSDKAEFEVVLPNDKVLEVKVAIYDNTGNVVFEKTQNSANVSWNLTNGAGRNVTNGSYLIVAEARGVKGNYAYSAKVGVKR